jgi:hypothetical protein
MDLERRIERLVERLEPIVERHPFISRCIGIFVLTAPFKGAGLIIDALGGLPWRFEGPWWAFFISIGFVSFAWAFFLMPLRTPEVGTSPKMVLGIVGPQYLRRWFAGSVLLFFAGGANACANDGLAFVQHTWFVGIIAPILVGAVYVIVLSARLLLAWLQQPRRRRG